MGSITSAFSSTPSSCLFIDNTGLGVGLNSPNTEFTRNCSLLCGKALQIRCRFPVTTEKYLIQMCVPNKITGRLIINFILDWNGEPWYWRHCKNNQKTSAVSLYLQCQELKCGGDPRWLRTRFSSTLFSIGCRFIITIIFIGRPKKKNISHSMSCSIVEDVCRGFIVWCLRLKQECSVWARLTPFSPNYKSFYVHLDHTKPLMRHPYRPEGIYWWCPACFAWLWPRLVSRQLWLRNLDTTGHPAGFCLPRCKNNKNP